MGQFKQDLEAKNSLGAAKTDIFLNIGYVYDAMWTIALALNSSISILEERGLGRLEDFTYDSVEMANIFTEAILNVSFEGISVSGSYQTKQDFYVFHIILILICIYSMYSHILYPYFKSLVLVHYTIWLRHCRCSHLNFCCAGKCIISKKWQQKQPISQLISV